LETPPDSNYIKIFELEVTLIGNFPLRELALQLMRWIETGWFQILGVLSGGDESRKHQKSRYGEELIVYYLSAIER
jgi:hypothetical protein